MLRARFSSTGSESCVWAQTLKYQFLNKNTVSSSNLKMSRLVFQQINDPKILTQTKVAIETKN